ncbi:MAG: glycosyltransferase [Micropruina sp.]|uniref:glycosyltransferase n=1 Tax=Micropruina sp. TaxID=2737536 RepID=UPI0039E5F784
MAITVSESSANAIKEWLSDDKIRVVNAGNGCSSIFDAELVTPLRLDRPYFLYVGNFKPHKNPMPAFQAMKEFPEHLLVVVTSDTEAADAMTETVGLGDRVKVHANVPDDRLARLYAGCEALLFPSILEGFGLPVVEALKTGGKVIFYSGAAAVREICEGTQFGVEDANSSGDFAAAMRLACTQPFRRPPTIDKYDWDDVADRVNSVLEEVV